MIPSCGKLVSRISLRTVNRLIQKCGNNFTQYHHRFNPMHYSPTISHIHTSHIQNRTMTTSTKEKFVKELYTPENGAVPDQLADGPINMLCNVDTELAHLKSFVTKVPQLELVDKLELKLRAAKKAGNDIVYSEILTHFVGSLLNGRYEEARVSWHDMTGIQTPDIFHWNLMFAYATKQEDYSFLSEIYEQFKYAVIKRKLEGPTPITYSILLKAYSSVGVLVYCLEIYEDMFKRLWIPEIRHLKLILRAAALSGDPKSLHRFFTRIESKGIRIKPAELKTYMDGWNRRYIGANYLRKTFVTTGDWGYALAYALRVRNYRKASEMLLTCRDSCNLQPDARMYQIVLAACIRDGHFKERAKILFNKFKKYPKAIEVREEHFEFDTFMEDLLEYLGDKASDAPKTFTGESVKLTRTSRKLSRGLYSPQIKVVYDDGIQSDQFEWVPEYVQSKDQFRKDQEQARKAEELAKVMAKVREELAQL